MDASRFLRSKQSGSVLIICLAILVALTLIGVSGMRSASLETKMVGHMRQKNNAFQAAEAALKRGEQFFAPIVGTAGFDGSGGQLGPGAAEPDWWSEATWSNANSLSYVDPIFNIPTPPALTDVSEQPRYVVKYVGDIQVDNKTMNIGGYGQQHDGSKVSDFRVTARGRDNGSTVILQAYFGKRL